MAAAESAKSDRADCPPAEMPWCDVESLFREFGDGLRRFLVGVLRDASLADDVLQSTLIKVAERGHTAGAATLKGWLYRVAYNEALLVRRREATGSKVVREWLHRQSGESLASDQSLVRQETIEAVQAAIERLPPEQRQIVRMRIYDEKTFAVIAQELGIPLGTALGRMRLATSKLKAILEP